VVNDDDSPLCGIRDKKYKEGRMSGAVETCFTPLFWPLCK